MRGGACRDRDRGWQRDEVGAVGGGTSKRIVNRERLAGVAGSSDNESAGVYARLRGYRVGCRNAHRVRRIYGHRNVRARVSDPNALTDHGALEVVGARRGWGRDCKRERGCAVAWYRGREGYAPEAQRCVTPGDVVRWILSSELVAGFRRPGLTAGVPHRYADVVIAARSHRRRNGLRHECSITQGWELAIPVSRQRFVAR